MAAYKRNMGGEERNRRFKGWRLFFFLLGFFGTIWFSIPLLWNVRNIGGILGLLFSVCLMAGSCFLPRIAAHFSLKARKRARFAFGGCMILLFSWAAVLSACAACGDLFGYRSALALLQDAIGDVRRLEKISIENLL